MRITERILPYVLCATLSGCAGTGKLMTGEAPAAEFPAGYMCTNYSLPYMQAAYGLLKGEVDPRIDEHLIYLFRLPEQDCNPNDPEMKKFAEDTDTKHDRTISYKEALSGIRALQKRFQKR